MLAAMPTVVGLFTREQLKFIFSAQKPDGYPYVLEHPKVAKLPVWVCGADRKAPLCLKHFQKLLCMICKAT